MIIIEKKRGGAYWFKCHEPVLKKVGYIKVLSSEQIQSTIDQ
jgi:hypothetical protein